ncbi:hypothetical protein [Streptomyces sp. LN704]|uniref:hypothetical protein n=1 Tax=unclassified Streptomyces TaxID=2593676 RepID=UPI00371781C2
MENTRSAAEWGRVEQEGRSSAGSGGGRWVAVDPRGPSRAVEEQMQPAGQALRGGVPGLGCQVRQQAAQPGPGSRQLETHWTDLRHKSLVEGR